MSPRLGAVAVSAGVAVTLAGCGGSAQKDLRSGVRDITVDANDHDAAAVRRDVSAFERRVESAVSSGAISSAEGNRLAELATAVAGEAGRLAPSLTPAGSRPAPTTPPTTGAPAPAVTSLSPTPDKPGKGHDNKNDGGKGEDGGDG